MSSGASGDRLYLDANASRPAHPVAFEAYARAVAEIDAAANPAQRARVARTVLEAARVAVARAVGVDAIEIVFTSGGTEAAAWAVAGAMHAHTSGHLVVSALEHPAVANTAELVAKRAGYRLTQVAAPRTGRMEVAAMQAGCELAECAPSSGNHRPAGDSPAGAAGPTRLICLIAASNETGVLQPVKELARWCRSHQILCHTDAVQAMAHQNVQLRDWQVDLASWAGHKVGAVGAIGCLYVRRGVALQPPWLPYNPNGAQVQALEDSEISAPAAAALAAAMQARKPTSSAILQARRDSFEQALLARLPDIEIIGATVARLPHTSCVRFPGCEADGLMMALDLQGIVCSTGSACSSGSIEPSPVLLGMGLTPKQARETLRFSLDERTSETALAQLPEQLAALVARSRGQR